jgi:hypothetical protein
LTATWLADALRAGGCRVDESVVPDWKTRGHPGTFSPIGVLGHHTAGPRTGDLPSLKTVRDGRPDVKLYGPLSQLMLSRAGVWVPIAAGLAWHAGVGSCPWVPGNNGNRYLIGVEAESCGLVDDWTPAQREAYPRGVAALLRHMNAPASRFIGHREWAPSRKVDPAFWDLDAFRATVADYLEGDTMPDEATFKRWVQEAVVYAAVADDGNLKSGAPWLGARLAGVDGKTGTLGLLPGIAAAVGKPGAVDTAAIGREVASAVVAQLQGATGITEAQVEAAVRRVFGDAGTA